MDDWYQAHHKGVPGKPGVEADLKDSEILTLMIAQDYIPYPGERQYIGYLKTNHGGLFPRLVDQSPYNRRARGLQGWLEDLRQHWVSQLVGTDTHTVLLNTKPIPVVGMKRSKKRSDFADSAAYGYCAARLAHNELAKMAAQQVDLVRMESHRHLATGHHSIVEQSKHNVHFDAPNTIVQVVQSLI